MGTRVGRHGTSGAGDADLKIGVGAMEAFGEAAFDANADAVGEAAAVREAPGPRVAVVAGVAPEPPHAEATRANTAAVPAALLQVPIFDPHGRGRQSARASGSLGHTQL